MEKIKNNCFIYSILNKVNGKIYVGLTKQGTYRFAQHKSTLRSNTHANPHLQASWNKYGEDAFEFNVLEYCNKEDLGANEEWWIDFFESTNPEKGYNLRGGGQTNFDVSEETRKKLSEINKGENHWNYGKHHSEETRKKISEGMKKVPNPMHDEDICKRVANTRAVKYNSTGYYRVSKHNKSDCKQGYYWSYQWRENGKRKSINRTNIEKLKDAVISRGLKWCKISEMGEELSHG